MKKVIVLLSIIFLLFLNNAIAAEKISTMGTQGGRYQLLYIHESQERPLVNRQTGDMVGSISGLFLLDTENGRVWSYTPTITIGGEVKGENFTPVAVSGIGMNIKDYNAWMERLIEKIYKKEK